MNDKEIRQKRVAIAIHLFQEWITTGWTVGGEDRLRCIQGLPVGAEYVRGWIDNANETVCLVFYHPSFPELLLGDEIPLLEVSVSKTRETKLWTVTT